MRYNHKQAFSEMYWTRKADRRMREDGVVCIGLEFKVTTHTSAGKDYNNQVGLTW